MFNIISYNTYKLRTLSWCQISGKSRKEFTVIKLTRKTNNNNNNADKFKEEFTHAQHFKRLFERTLNIQTSSETIGYNHSILET